MSSCSLSSDMRHFQIHVEQLSQSIGDRGVRSDKSKGQSAVDLRTVDVFKQFKACLNSALKSVGEGTACKANIVSITSGLDFLNSDECDNLSDFWEQLKDVAKDVDIQMPSFKSKDLIQAESTSSIPNSDSILIASTQTSLSAAVPKNIFSTSSSSRSVSLAQAYTAPISTSTASVSTSAMPVSTSAVPVSTSAVPAPTSFSPNVGVKNQDERKESKSILSELSASTGETVRFTYLNNFRLDLNSWEIILAKSEDEDSLKRIHQVIETIIKELKSVEELVTLKKREVARPTISDLKVKKIQPQRESMANDALVYNCLRQMKNYFADHENFDEYLGENATKLLTDLNQLTFILKNFQAQVGRQITEITRAKSTEDAAVSSESR